MIRSTQRLFILLLFICSRSYGQDKYVLLEPQARQIAKNELLPAQTPFIIRMNVSSKTALIRIKVHRGSGSGAVIQDVSWIRPANFLQDMAEIPVSTRLHANSKYGFEVSIFDYLSDTEKVVLKNTIHTYLDNYLDAIMEADAKKIDVRKSPGKIVGDLNAILKQALTFYANAQQITFAGYSDIVKFKLEELQRARLSNGQYNLTRRAAKSALAPNDIKGLYAEGLMSQLKKMIFDETDNYLALDFVRLSDSFVIGEKSTERTQTLLPLFIGYGGIYLNGSAGNLDYDSKPYAGFAIPLGSGNSSYFARTSFIMGVFLNNIHNADGKVFTGPIVDRPIFAGLGFRALSFVHLQAGVVALSSEKLSLSQVKTSDISLKPFVGLSAQFNLWLGFNKK